MAITNDHEIYTDCLTAIDVPQLPVEVIIQIMSYLSVSDRMSAGLVNRVWREASLSMKFVDKQAMIYGPYKIDRLNEALDVLQQSTRPFYHFQFTVVELKSTMPIWEKYGPEMRSLIITLCELSERTLVDILKCCKDLRVLHIDGCRSCLMSGRLLDDENDVKELSEKFQSLHELSLANNRYLSDALFNRLVAICPNLDSLNLLGCQISFHCGLYKKFYPNNDVTPYASESVLTFLNVLYYVTQRADRLKHLNFSHTLIDGTALATLSTVNNLKLESLAVQCCDQLTIVGIRGLAEHQSHLKVLDISMCTRVTDASLLSICKNLRNLESLSIRRCRAVTDSGVRLIHQLKKLKELDISECEQLTGKSIIELCQGSSENVNSNTEDGESCDRKIVPNNILEKLWVNALRLDEKSMECIAESFPKLRLLDIGYCFSAVTDKTVQMLFKNLVLLRELNLSHCDKVSDAGLTGMGAGCSEATGKNSAESSPQNTETKLRINLRSRAEEEIVRDATRKTEIMRLCEDESRPVNTKTSTGFSMIRLQGLVKLNLYGCNRITDVSLKYAFAFLELKILDLSNCQQITQLGLDYLTRNNPSIEDLTLSYCHNISDTGVSYVAQRLHRLKILQLEGCSRLSQDSIVSINQYCKSLQYLNVRDCPGVTPLSTENVSNICIALTKPTETVYSVHVKSPMPPPPPPPFPRL